MMLLLSGYPSKEDEEVNEGISQTRIVCLLQEPLA